MPTTLDLHLIALLGGGALLAIIFIILLSGRGRRIHVAPNPVSLRQYDTAAVKVEVQHRAFAGAKWRPMPGTLLLRDVTGGSFAVTPDRGATADHKPTFEFTVTATAVGTGTFRISATPAGQRRACVALVPVQVEPNPDNRRQIRHTAAALAASIWKS